MDSVVSVCVAWKAGCRVERVDRVEGESGI